MVCDRQASILRRGSSDPPDRVVIEWWDLIVSGGHYGSSGVSVARWRAFQGRWGSSGMVDGGRVVRGKRRGSVALGRWRRPNRQVASLRTRSCRGAAGEAGGHVQDAVADGVDLALGEVGVAGEPDQLRPGHQIGCFRMPQGRDVRMR